MLRKYAVALCVVALVAGSVKPVLAAPGHDVAVVVSSSAKLGTIGSVAVGFVGAIAVICAYDLFLKINGLKNWDGTPKKGVKLPF